MKTLLLSAFLAIAPVQSVPDEVPNTGVTCQENAHDIEIVHHRLGDLAGKHAASSDDREKMILSLEHEVMQKLLTFLQNWRTENCKN